MTQHLSLPRASDCPKVSLSSPLDQRKLFCLMSLRLLFTVAVFRTVQCQKTTLPLTLQRGPACSTSECCTPHAMAAPATTLTRHVLSTIWSARATNIGRLA